jgi:hypothetical protein
LQHGATVRRWYSPCEPSWWLCRDDNVYVVHQIYYVAARTSYILPLPTQPLVFLCPAQLQTQRYVRMVQGTGTSRALECVSVSSILFCLHINFTCMLYVCWFPACVQSSQLCWKRLSLYVEREAPPALYVYYRLSVSPRDLH